MEPKVKTLEDLKKDKVDLEKQIEQVKQQLMLLTGASLYVAQEIAKLEKPAAQPKAEEAK